MNMNEFADNLNIIQIIPFFDAESDSTFTIRVHSDDFSGAHKFCVYKEHLIKSIAELELMNEKLDGNCVICDADSHSYIRFDITRIGHVTISGEMGMLNGDNYLKFRTFTDQTIIPYVIKMLQKLV